MLTSPYSRFKIKEEKAKIIIDFEQVYAFMILFSVVMIILLVQTGYVIVNRNHHDFIIHQPWMDTAISTDKKIAEFGGRFVLTTKDCVDSGHSLILSDKCLDGSILLPIGQ